MVPSQGFTATSAAIEDFSRYIHINQQDHITRLPDELKLNFTQHLSVGDLGHLSQTSTLFRDLITPILYTRDNQDENPRAIFWAASVDPVEVDDEDVMAVLDLAIGHGGNLNKNYGSTATPSFIVTPLHLAAASGNLCVVKKLLKHGANPNALGKKFLYNSEPCLDHGDFDVRMANINQTIAVASRFSWWRPLFVPFVLGHEGIIQALLRSGASPVLAVPYTTSSASEPSNINILHIITSQKKREYTDRTGLSYFMKYSNLINVVVPRGETPLSIALHHGDIDLIRDIVANGGNVEGVSELGTTPLIQAIQSFCNGQTVEIRKECIELVHYLVKSCNAGVGKHSDARVLQTPLTCAVNGLAKEQTTTWKNAIKDITSIINLLLDHGADVNEQSNHGYSALGALCRIICQRTKRAQKKYIDELMDLFKELVKKREADINARFDSGGSILGTCILKFGREPSGFLKTLLELNAKLAPAEINPVFRIWVSNRSLRKPEFNMLAYSKDVTQYSIDFAYRACLTSEEKSWTKIWAEIWKQFQSHFPHSTVPKKIAAEALLQDDSLSKRFSAAIHFKNLDGSYIHTDGNSFLHLIVNRLERFPKYISHAVPHARHFLRLNASVEATDSNGRTALDKLMHMRMQGDESCDPLRYFLLHIEKGQQLLWKEYQDKTISKEEYVQKYKELIEM